MNWVDLLDLWLNVLLTIMNWNAPERARLAIKLNRQVRSVVRTAQVSPLPRLFDPFLELEQRLRLELLDVICLSVVKAN